MKRGRFFLLVCGFVFLVFLSNVQAQEKYPNRSIEIVVPFSAGGSTDLQTRMYSEKLAQTLKTQVIVVNRGAGGGIQGTLYVARAKKDGYTLLSSGNAITSNFVISKEATYDPFEDFIPLGYLGYAPFVCTVKSGSLFKTFAELVEYARKNPGKLKISEGGGMSPQYFNIELMRAKNIQLTIIPFAGGGEATLALLGGHVDMMFSTIINLGPHIKAGKLLALAITGQKRLPLFPDVPTATELGYPYMIFQSWTGLFAPSGIPQSAFNVLVEGVEKTFKDPEVIKNFATIYVMPDYKGPEEFREIMKSEISLMEKIAKDVGLQIK